LYVLDLSGNEIRRFNSHASRVNSIDIDAMGDYVATAADDG
jgi:WD40 repeat protein